MISIKENVYLVRLLELPSEDIEIEDDEKIKWPQTIASELLPRVDGTLILYDVTDKGSIEELPEMLCKSILFVHGKISLEKCC